MYATNESAMWKALWEFIAAINDGFKSFRRNQQLRAKRRQRALVILQIRRAPTPDWLKAPPEEDPAAIWQLPRYNDYQFPA